MAHTYEELKGKTVDELREIAKGLDNEAVKGFSQLNKEHLLPALCKALGIDTHNMGLLWRFADRAGLYYRLERYMHR